jgi:dTDP-4-amino-4,6-dideoxygalactose transaminase
MQPTVDFSGFSLPSDCQVLDSMYFDFKGARLTEPSRDSEILEEVRDIVTIPFNRSSLQGRELEYIFQTISAGQIAGDQIFSKKCHALLERLLNVKKALVTTSCTHALEMAAILLDIHPGDEVIVPSFTFVSTPNAFVMHGARPVFCDVRSDTLNMDESKLESLITPRTKGIIPVHYAGVACEMDAIMEIAQRYHIPVVEDNAHGLFGKYKGRSLGTLGCMATQSFHETKNITCGEGGALLINEERFVERAEIIREKGTNRSKFFQGQVDKYSWVDVGSSYVMSDVLAAFLYAQLEVWQKVQSKRSDLWNYYHVALASWCLNCGVRQPIVPEHCEQAFHMYYLLLPSFAMRKALIAHLKAHGVLAVFHYLPLHLSKYAARWDGVSTECPVTEDVSDRLLRLPFYNSISQEDQERVIEAIVSFKLKE